MEKVQEQCPLCGNLAGLSRTHATQAQDLAECELCGLIFKSPATFMNWIEQKERYDLHNNDPEDAGYENFLNKLIEPLLPHLPPQARLLDWGSGPFPALKTLMSKRGWSVEIFDPIYAPEEPQGLYDAIVSTEVIEHFQNPRESFDEMISYLAPQGILGMMTEIYRPEVDFHRWWYVKDPTHVVFYQEKTIHYLAQKYEMELLYLEKSVFILKRNRNSKN